MTTDKERQLRKALSDAKDHEWRAKLAYESAYDYGRYPKGIGVCNAKEREYLKAKREVSSAQENLDRYDYNLSVSLD